MSIEEITLPSFFCPFLPAVSPYAEAVHQHTLEWVRRHALIKDERAFEHLRSSKFGWLAARAHPNAPLEGVTIASDWFTWLFLMDDECDECGIGKRPERLAALQGQFLRVLSGGQPEAPLDPEFRDVRKRIDVPLLHALCDLRDRMEARMPRAWRARFIHSVVEYFESSKWEAANRARGIWPDAPTYIRMRPYTGALYTDIELIDMTEGIALPLAVRKHPLVQRLMLITNNVVCWSNDIFSLPKERAHLDMHNLALILQHKEEIPLQTAVDRVAVLTDKEVRRFIELEALLPSFGAPLDADVRRFIGVLRAWMRGNLDWSYESGRYRPTVASAPMNVPEHQAAGLGVNQ
ncbi:MAG: terpene synthase family protein [Gammaproteobacteria bacterium]